VSRGGLHQVCSRRRAELQGAQGRQAVPPRGLLQVCSRRHGPLQGMEAAGGQQAGCLTAAQGGTPHCIAHGVGKRQHEGCPKAAAGGGTQNCQAHGGGKRCQQEGCSKPVARSPGSVYCRLCPPSA
jgi:hypothetical protein